MSLPLSFRSQCRVYQPIETTQPKALLYAPSAQALFVGAPQPYFPAYLYVPLAFHSVLKHSIIITVYLY